VVRSTPQCWLTDMDGVLVHEENALPGASTFSPAREKKRPFLVLTNNSIFTAARPVRAGCCARLSRARGGDLDVRPGHRRHFWPTSCLADRPT
jgi:hypothetical protein